jgi:hypothetical protein
VTNPANPPPALRALGIATTVFRQTATLPPPAIADAGSTSRIPTHAVFIDR